MELLGSPAISQYHLVSFCAYPFCLTGSTQPSWVLVWSANIKPFRFKNRRSGSMGAWNLHEFTVQTRSEPLIQTLGFGMIIPTVWDSPCSLRPTRYQLPSPDPTPEPYWETISSLWDFPSHHYVKINGIFPWKSSSELGGPWLWKPNHIYPLVN